MEDVPVLCIVDELESLGWVRVNHLVTHRAGGELQYDGRGLPAKRFYLQCVLVSNVLFGMGVVDFRSDRQQGFYHLLLHWRKEEHNNQVTRERWLMLRKSQ